MADQADAAMLAVINIGTVPVSIWRVVQNLVTRR